MTDIDRWRLGDDIAPVRALVGRGGILAIPTESSYGLAVDPMSERAVAALFDVKGRPADKPLPVVLAGVEQLARLGVPWPTAASGGLESLWPAALSLLLPMTRPVPAAAGRERLALRVPEHAGLRALLGELGRALTATSANVGGAPPILDPDGLVDLLAGRDAMIVDGGVLAGGPPSTLVRVDGAVATIVRQGRVGRSTLERAAPALGFRRGGFSAETVEISVEETT